MKPMIAITKMPIMQPTNAHNVIHPRCVLSYSIGPDGLRYAAIRQLPKAEAALVLLYLEDLSYREIADVLVVADVMQFVPALTAKVAPISS